MPAVTLSSRPRRTWALAAAAAASLALGIAVLGLTAPAQQGRALLAALQRPARTAAANMGPGPATAVVRDGRYQLTIGLHPNRASRHDRLALRLTKDGRAIANARVAVTFSMPQMNMWGAFTTVLVPGPGGAYTGPEPVLGMPGLWQLRLKVTVDGRSSLIALVNDRMGS
jgi:hypothetical protein